MSNLTKRKIGKAVVPVNFHLIAYGCVWGSFIGLTNLLGGGGVDLAASRGVAGFVSVTIGVFIGMKLVLLSMNAIRLWIARIEDKLRVLEQRVSYLTGESGLGDPPEEPRERPSPLMVRLKIYFVLLGGGLSGTGVVVMQLVIKAGTDIYGPGVSLAALICAAITLFGVLGTTTELWLISRAASKIERRLDYAEDILPSPVVYARDANAALQSTQSWVYRVTGMRDWNYGARVVS